MYAKRSISTQNKQINHAGTDRLALKLGVKEDIVQEEGKEGCAFSLGGNK